MSAAATAHDERAGDPTGAATVTAFRTRLSSVGLAAGWVALATAVLVAHRSPATGYELSIYRATPTEFWAGIGLAAMAALAVAWQARVPRRLRLAALGLVGSAGFAVAALPVLRGYYYVGAGDALTHLGWAADLAVGRLEPAGLLYPAVHSVAVFLARVTGVELALAMQYAVLAFVACFLLFVPLCARAVAGSDRALVAGTFAAAMFLPVNNVSAHLVAHPTTQAVLLLPAVLYLAVRYVTAPNPAGEGGTAGSGGGSGRLAALRRLASPGRLRPTPYGALLALLAVGTVLVHPQMGLAVAGAFAAIAALQAYGRRRRPTGPAARHRSLTGHAVLTTLAFAVWAPRNERVQGAIQSVLDNLLGSAAVADEVTQRGGSLAALGSGLLELFLKLFAPTLVFGLLAAGVVLAAVVGRLDGDPERATLVRYLAVAGLPAVAGFVLFFGVSVSTQAFRYVAFGAVVVTVLGAVALAAVTGRLAGRRSGVAVRAAVVVGLAVLLPLAAMTAFASPFVYQGSPGVTEGEVVGYEAAFDHRAPDVPFTGVRSGPIRYVHAIHGTTPVQAGDVAVPGHTAAIPGEEFGPGVVDRYDVARYVPVTDRTVAREVGLYDGLRYDSAGFETLRTAPGVHRVRANGDFRLYLLDGSGA